MTTLKIKMSKNKAKNRMLTEINQKYNENRETENKTCAEIKQAVRTKPKNC
jgi:hypothetical protein